jgi:choline dehydrogenase-like flavoprotein
MPIQDAMFYTRGSSSDFDRFARVTGDPGWSWDQLQTYIKKVGDHFPNDSSNFNIA